MSQTKQAFSQMKMEHLSCAVRKVIVHVNHNHKRIMVRNATSGKCVTQDNWYGTEGSACGGQVLKQVQSRKGRHHRLGSSRWGRRRRTHGVWRRRTYTKKVLSRHPYTPIVRHSKSRTDTKHSRQPIAGRACSKEEQREHLLAEAYKKADEVAEYNVTKNCGVNGRQPCTKNPLPASCKLPCQKVKKWLDGVLKEAESQAFIDQMTEVASVMMV